MQFNCDPFWVDDPILLMRIDRIIEFYPTLDMCSNERINAITRFILYAGFCVSFVKKNMTPVTISLAMIATLAFLYNSKADKKMLKKYFHEKKNCVSSTNNNPFMNLLPLDSSYGDKRNMEPCKYTHKRENNDDFYQTQDDKQWNTVPSQTNEDYLKFLYQGNIGGCKNGENPELCKP